MMLGAGAVGKSEMVGKWMGHQVDTLAYDPTVGEEQYRKQVVVNNRVYQISIIDTPGQADNVLPEHIGGFQCRGFMLVFDFTSRTSFDELAQFADIVARVDPPVPIVAVVGNKCEMQDLRAVTTEEGEEFAASIGAPFFECSARKSLNLDDAFAEAARQVLLREEQNALLNADGGESKTLGSKFKRLFRKA